MRAEERKAAAPANEEACAICRQPKWMHILPAHLRGDAHPFRPQLTAQLELAFAGVKHSRPNGPTVADPIAKRKSAEEAKKPLQKSSMQKAGQKKPLQHGARKAAKPGKRSVA